jgi:hypothetical protein
LQRSYMGSCRARKGMSRRRRPEGSGREGGVKIRGLSLLVIPGASQIFPAGNEGLATLPPSLPSSLSPSLPSYLHSPGRSLLFPPLSSTSWPQLPDWPCCPPPPTASVA